MNSSELMVSRDVRFNELEFTERAQTEIKDHVYQLEITDEYLTAEIPQLTQPTEAADPTSLD